MKPLRWLGPLLLAAAAALGQAPMIAAVENAATNVPPGLPNAGIARGALFVVKGTNLGPASLAIAAAFPLQTTIGGTSIQVTVGGTTADAIMYYSLAAQVAAILPSKTPTGTGTVKVTYNGQSASAPITVVQNNIGIFTVSQTGSGDAIAFLPDNGLVSPNHAANPGETVIFWGTGLGPVTSDESQPAVQADMANVPLQVFIGGKQANIVFRGRNACCTAVDTVYATVPQGVTGCAVGVFMQIGNVVSNGTSIAVASSGRTCTPTSLGAPVGPGTSYTGTISLLRSVTTIPGIGPVPGSTTKMDGVSASFTAFTASSQLLGSQVDGVSYGSCIVFTFLGLDAPTPFPSGGTTQSLDAGAMISMTGPAVNRPLTKSTAGGAITYSNLLDNTATTLVPGQYTFTGTGGADVGPFAATYDFPQPFTWTNQANVTVVNRASGVTVTWAGGDASGSVAVFGVSILVGTTPANSAGAAFACAAAASSGSFTVPPEVLLALPPSGSVAGFPVPGFLSVTGVSFPGTFHASGIDAGYIGSTFLYLGPATYQ